MAAITNIQGLSDGNQIQGTFPDLTDSRITFTGKNNILYCEPGVSLINSTLQFKGNNSVIYLRSSCFPYQIDVSIFEDMIFHMGKDTYTNQKMSIRLAEHKHCFIGDRCLFAPNVFIRLADPHLIYDCATRKRLNPSRSVYIGDHVWLGQESMILKGTRIDSGSIVGARSVVTGDTIPHNTIWVGSPARQVKEGIFWNHMSVQNWTDELTEASQIYDDLIETTKAPFPINDGIFEYDPAQALDYEEIEQQLNSRKTSQERCDYLTQLNSKIATNRFVHQ